MTEFKKILQQHEVAYCYNGGLLSIQQVYSGTGDRCQ